MSSELHKHIETATLTALSYSVSAAILLSSVSAIDAESTCEKAIDAVVNKAGADKRDTTADDLRRVLRRTAEWILENVAEPTQ